jgi:phage pi2 protein 07
MQIKFYKGEKLLAISDSLPQGSSERERHIMSMIYMCEDYDRCTVDNERIIINKIGDFGRMAYSKIPFKEEEKVQWYSGYYFHVIGKTIKEAYEKLSGMVLICPNCRKKLTIDWFGVFHSCPHKNGERSFILNYDLYELFHLRKYNQQFWKEVNDHNV